MTRRLLFRLLAGIIVFLQETGTSGMVLPRVQGRKERELREWVRRNYKPLAVPVVTRIQGKWTEGQYEVTWVRAGERDLELYLDRMHKSYMESRPLAYWIGTKVREDMKKERVRKKDRGREYFRRLLGRE